MSITNPVCKKKMLKRYLHIMLGSSGLLVPCPNDRCQLKRTHDIGGATITRGRPGVSGHWATRGDGSSSGERFRGHPSAARRRQAHRPASRPSGTGRPSDTKAMKASEFFLILRRNRTECIQSLGRVQWGTLVGVSLSVLGGGEFCYSSGQG